MLASLVLAVACSAPFAQSSAPKGQAPAAEAPPTESRVTSVALFKNGFAFVRRRAEAPAGGKSVRLGPLPVPVHGSFWIAGDPAQIKVGAATARKDRLTERSPALTVEEILRANVGRKLTLFLGDKESLTGTLVSMPEPQPRLPEPWVPVDTRYGNPGFGAMPVIPQPSLLLLETSGGTVALAPGEVRRVAAEGGDLAREIERSREATSLSVALEPASAGPSPLTIFYLERGLTWAPSYAIDLSAAGRATLTAKAEVIDEAEDLDAATLELVTGFPNLRFSDVISPIAMQGDLASFLSALSAGGSDMAQSAMTQQVLANVAYARERGPAFPTSDGPPEGSSVEDLFLYTVPNVTLKRGERGLYPLFSASVPYAHVYEWDIPDTLDRPEADHETRTDVVDIWHSVRLTNDSGVPWTTAPAMTMKDGNLLGQDQLAYTPVGGRTTVRITRAVDVQGDRAEYEVSRDRNAATFYSSSYDKVTVRGEIQVTNLKHEAIELEITKHVQGDVAKNPDEAAVSQVAEGLRRVNPTTRLIWRIPLKEGEERTLTYEYALYLRP
jgi:hypothetical protein